MELIPILSTIILVATICTFILAIGAYILYKVREGKPQYAYQTKPASVQGELVVPSESVYTKDSSVKENGQIKSVEPGITREEYTKQRQPSQSKFTPEPRGYKIEEEKVEKQKIRVKPQERFSDENKLLMGIYLLRKIEIQGK
jgi:FlaG/FlaF family flagellin (archaellin)